jgi:hypothetical protein
MFHPETCAAMRERDPTGKWEEGQSFAYGDYTSPKWAEKAFDRVRTRRPDLLWSWGRNEENGNRVIYKDHNDY